MIDMARHMDVAMAGLSPSTWRLFSDLELKLCFYLQQSCRLTFIQRDVVILESSAAETTTIQGTITFMVVDTGTSYQSITSLDLFFRGQFGKNKALRNLPVFRAAAVSTSEDKIVSKSDAAQNSEERKSKN